MQVDLAGKLKKNALQEEPFPNTKVKKGLLELETRCLGELGDIEKSICIESKTELFLSFDRYRLTRVIRHTGCAESKGYHSGHFQPMK